MFSSCHKKKNKNFYPKERPYCLGMSGRHLEGIWKASGGCLKGVWRLSEGCLEVVRKESERCQGYHSLKFLNPKFFWNKNCFGPTNFLTRNFLGPKIFKNIADQTFFWTKYYLTQNSKFFSTQAFFLDSKFSDPNLF